MTDALRLEDGPYDVLVVDATAADDDVAIELAILSGEHKGEVITIRARGFDADETDLLGLPGTLHVENGTPRFVLHK